MKPILFRCNNCMTYFEIDGRTGCPICGSLHIFPNSSSAESAADTSKIELSPEIRKASGANFVQLKILNEIREERNRQEKKWGTEEHHPLVWLPIFMEEVGEVAKAMYEAMFHTDGDTWEDYRKELIHAAAVATAMAECFDRNGAPK